MDVSRRNALRALLALTILCAVVFLGQAAAAAGATDSTVEQRQISGDVGGPVVITAHGDTENSKILVYGTDGGIRYVNSTYDRYFDVDPVPGTHSTVTYTAAMHVYGEPCSVGSECTRNVIERLNITTGETEVLHREYEPGIGEHRWHDADRIGKNRYVVAGIAGDRVYVVNVSAGVTEWAWHAQVDFPVREGGRYPEDWTHVNDVEVTPDGRIVASLRNQDQVVFLDRQTGLVEEWTLGSEDETDVLFEQHNPDYIPSERGGPALLVADSQNHRIVEYERRDGEWKQTWVWDDGGLPWPRDADRLPDGRTLVTGSNSNRVFAVDRDGDVVWSVTVETPYEAERLGTGDESAGGAAASELGLTSVDAGGTTKGGGAGADPGSILRQVLLFVRGLLPPVLTNAILYVLPQWMHFAEIGALLAAIGAVTAWTAIEYWWWDRRIRLRLPIELS